MLNVRHCAVVPVILIGCLTAGALAQEAAQRREQSLADAREELADALRENDVAALGELLAEDFLLIDPEGRTSDRASLLKGVEDGFLTIQGLEVGPMRTKQHGDVGIMQGPVHLRLTHGPREAEVAARFAVTAVFVRQEGQWRLAAAQMTFVRGLDGH